MSHFCKNCKNHITPHKSINWLLLIILALFSAGTWIILYIFYFLYIKKPICPICKSKNIIPKKEVDIKNSVDNTNLSNFHNSIKEFSNYLDKFKTTSKLNKSRVILGTILTIIGGIFSFIGVLGLFANNTLSDILKIGVFFTLTGVLPLGFGINLIRQYYKDINKITYEELERRILYLASLNNNRLKLIDIAKNTELTLSEAEEFLKNMEKKGYVRSNLLNDGTIEYKF